MYQDIIPYEYVSLLSHFTYSGFIWLCRLTALYLIAIVTAFDK